MLYLGIYVLSEIGKVRGFMVWSENIIFRVVTKLNTFNESVSCASYCYVILN